MGTRWGILRKEQVSGKGEPKGMITVVEKWINCYLLSDGVDEVWYNPRDNDRFIHVDGRVVLDIPLEDAKQAVIKYELTKKA